MGEAILTEEMSMDALMASSAPAAAEGEIITARVVEIREDGLLVDVGMKTESFIPMKEFGPQCPFKAGDELPVLIRINFGRGEQHHQVSWRKAREVQAWDRIQQAFSKQTHVSGKISQRVKGGLIVDLGLEAFLPASQVDYRTPDHLDAWVGREVQCLVIECDKHRSNVVLSRRRWLEQERALKKEAVLKELIVGQTHQGRVTGVTSFGAFIDIGGIEGLLHISDISWSRPNKVESALKVGDEIEVKVLKFDPATERLSLGRKQLIPHPWEGVERRYGAGQIVKGVVSGLAAFGAFVELEPGIEGLIHVSELSWNERIRHPNEVLKVGQELETKIVSINPVEQRIALSLRRMGSNPWEDASILYPAGTRLRAEVSHLASFGAFLKLPVGVEGLLRVQDMSWTKKIRHPSEVLQPGQVIEVVVMEVDPRQEKIALGLKQLSSDPVSKLRVGQAVSGKVINVVEFGAFVELESGLEALVRKSEQPETPLVLEQVVTAIVIKVQQKERKVELSVKRYDKDQQRALMKKYAGTSDRLTLGDATDWKNSSSS